MITFDTFYTIQRVSGLSQDDKPLGMKPGSIFMELDTGKTFIFDGETWHEQPSGGGSGGGGGGVTTLHINVTAVNRETMEVTFTADKTPAEMKVAAAAGPVWCVITFAAGIMAEEAVSIGAPPAWYGGAPAFGSMTENAHNDAGNNKTGYAVRWGGPDKWIFDATQFGG